MKVGRERGKRDKWHYLSGFFFKIKFYKIYFLGRGIYENAGDFLLLRSDFHVLAPVKGQHIIYPKQRWF